MVTAFKKKDRLLHYNIRFDSQIIISSTLATKSLVTNIIYRTDMQDENKLYIFMNCIANLA